MQRITFEYRDEWSRGEWRRQSCVVSSLYECFKIYDLDSCEHRIVSIEEVD